MSIYNERRNQQGLTLVELLIAMALGLVLALGVVEIFIANRTTLNVQEGMARVQENGRFAVQQLATSIRGAGFFGCAGMESIVPSVIANDPPADLSSITINTPIDGLDNVAAVNTYNAVAGTDVIILRGAGDEGVGLTGNTTDINANIQVTSGYGKFEADDLLFITDCAAADLFRANSVSVSGGTTTITHSTAANTTNFLSRAYGDDAIVLKPFVQAYYVRDSGRDNVQGADIMSLYMLDIDSVEYELVEGVANLQVLYGVDSDTTRGVDIYMDAGQITTAGDWDKVMSARIALLVDSIDDSLLKSADFTFLGVSSTPADKRIRAEFTGLFVIRNRTL